FLVPLFAIGIHLLFGEAPNEFTRAARGVRRKPSPSSISLPLASPTEAFGRRSRAPSFDLLQVPFVGRFLRWRHARVALQMPMAVLAGLLILDGLCGPQVAPMNLAGVLPWIHWRGLLIVCLLAAGNFFCLACPFTLPRSIARHWLPAGRNWP